MTKPLDFEIRYSQENLRTPSNHEVAAGDIVVKDIVMHTQPASPPLETIINKQMTKDFNTTV